VFLLNNVWPKSVLILWVCQLSMQILRATVSDVEAVYSLYQRVYGNYNLKGLDQYPEDSFFDSTSLESLLGHHVGFVAFHQDSLVGCVLTYIDPTCPVHAVIDDLVVDPAYRHRGIAALLVAHANKFLDEQGVVMTSVQTVTSQPYSQLTFMRSGFKDIVGFDLCRYPRVYQSGVYESVFVHRRYHHNNLLSGNVKDVLSNHKTVFVPPCYRELISCILKPTQALFPRKIQSHHTNYASKMKLQYSVKHEAFGVMIYVRFHPVDSSSDSCEKNFLDMISGYKKKHVFILVKIETTDLAIIPLTQLLTEYGFVFHSILLGGEIPFDTNKLSTDQLSLQWVSPCRLPYRQGLVDLSNIQIADVSVNSVGLKIVRGIEKRLRSLSLLKKGEM